jgi:selenocysteine-specific elongation factor
MHVVATAGHVDHGKSTLVRQLTGMEPDRWAEERRRGLTIDLGFAWTRLPGGEEIAFVDVPGHERFVPNMLAGVGPVPAVMIVVAADGGWMPQSAEHLAALDALQVRHGLLVVTRSDLADPAPARAEALAHIGRTSLGEVPSVVVSGTTGAGLDDLRAALDALVRRLPPPDLAADVRLWVDRSFTVTGAGTVVTGTLAGGTLRTGDELVHSSSGQRVRVRGLQTLGRKKNDVPSVARVAVNLRGVDRHTVARGDALLTPHAWLVTSTVDVTAGAELPTRLVVHVGAAAIAAHVRPLGTTAARLSLAQPLPLRVGDRLLLRDPGRHQVVGGATVLDVRPPALSRRGAARSRGAELETGPARPRGFVRGADLRAMGLGVTGEPLAEDWYADDRTLGDLITRLRTEFDAWKGPLESGVPTEAVRQHLGLPDPVLVAPLARAAGLRTAGGRVQRPGSDALPPALDAALHEIEADLRDAPFAAPDANRLAQLGLGARQLAAAVRAGRLVKVADGIVLLPGALEQAAARLVRLPQPFTLSQARQELGTSRRVAVPLLELLDREGLTRRLPDSTRVAVVDHTA